MRDVDNGTVNPKPHTDTLALRVEVDVSCSFANRVAQDPVHQSASFGVRLFVRGTPPLLEFREKQSSQIMVHFPARIGIA
jgi:hypothetical protein